MKKTIVSIASLFVLTSVLLGGAKGEPEKTHVAGYILTAYENVPESYGGGYSMYTAIWPFLETHPGKFYQSGLMGTWMYAQNEGNPSRKIGSDKTGGVGYSTIEGGTGVWRSNHFPTITPKFQMGGVTLNFNRWANGPGSGKGNDWNNDLGRYGVAQLSPWLLFPPDGLNFKQGTSGEYLGRAYLPLPLIPAKETTAGKDLPTGGNCWTLFFNSKTFKGPVAFFTPYYFSQETIEHPHLSGKFLDSRPSRSNRQVQMETQYLPAKQAYDSKGELYARTGVIRFPRNTESNSILIHQNRAYDKSALWDKVDAWFNGGPVASGQFIDTGSYVCKLKDESYGAAWKFVTGEGKAKRKVPIQIKDFMRPIRLDEVTYAMEWDEEMVEMDEDYVKLPEYFQLRGEGKEAMWFAVKKEAVPEETGLHALTAKDFHDGRNDASPHTTPTEPESCWKTPGPSSGPFEARLGDGSVVTYYWYKFCDQPALLNADLSLQEREELQRKVELLHRHWKKDQEYLAPQNLGELVEFDPALLVTPPAGMEVGYVPIATEQSLIKP